MSRHSAFASGYRIGGVIALVLGAAHFLLPGWGLRRAGATVDPGGPAQPFRRFGTYAIGMFLLCVSVMSFHFAQLGGSPTARLFAALQAIFWAGRILLEMLFPSHLQIFFLGDPPVALAMISVIAAPAIRWLSSLPGHHLHERGSQDALTAAAFSSEFRYPCTRGPRGARRKDRDDEETHCGNSRPADACCTRLRRGQLSVQAHHDDRAVRARGIDRRDRPRRRRGAAPVLGQVVVVENRGGAGGSIGTAAIATAPPDGYTIGMGTASTLAINPATYKNLPFDVLDDLVPIGKIADVPNIMSINPSLAASDMASFIALARAQPGKLSYASAGIGSVSHLLGEQFKLATGTDIVHVPYRGVAPALTDVIAGQVDVMFDNLPTSLPLVQDGRLRPLGVSGDRRVAALPDVPTFAELTRRHELDGVLRAGRTQGHAGYRREETQRGAVAGAGDARGARQALAQQAIVAGGSPEAFEAQIVRELARMRRAVAAAGIQLE